MGEERDDRERRFNEIAEHIPGDLGVLLYLAGWAKEVLDALAAAEARAEKAEGERAESLRALGAAQKFANASPTAELLREFGDLEAERDAAVERDESWQRIVKSAVTEADALRAEIETLREAGEGLVNVLHYVQTAPETDTGAPVGNSTALDAWRKAVDASAGTCDGSATCKASVHVLGCFRSTREAVDASAGGEAADPFPSDGSLSVTLTYTPTIAGVPIKDTLAPLPEEYRR